MNEQPPSCTTCEFCLSPDVTERVRFSVTSSSGDDLFFQDGHQVHLCLFNAYPDKYFNHVTGFYVHYWRNARFAKEERDEGDCGFEGKNHKPRNHSASDDVVERLIIKVIDKVAQFFKRS